jgi:hypothetical protein
MYWPVFKRTDGFVELTGGVQSSYIRIAFDLLTRIRDTGWRTSVPPKYVPEC